MRYMPTHTKHALDYATMTLPQESVYYGEFTDEPYHDILEASKHSQLKGAGGHGYSGMTCDEISLLYSDDGAMVRVAGEGAHFRFFRYYVPDCNVTRIDLQTTAWYDEQPNEVIEDVLRSAKECKAAKLARKYHISENRNDQGGFTVYLGARSSEVFMRVYNKHHQSGDEAYYKGAVRYELELKGAVGDKVGHEIANTYTPGAGQERHLQERIGATVATQFGRRGVVVPSEVLGEPIAIASPRKRSDAQQKLNWLAKSVAPSVRWLGERGMMREALEALGLSFLAECLDNGPQEE